MKINYLTPTFILPLQGGGDKRRAKFPLKGEVYTSLSPRGERGRVRGRK
jgi:hypothetical protein